MSVGELMASAQDALAGNATACGASAGASIFGPRRVRLRGLDQGRVGCFRNGCGASAHSSNSDRGASVSELFIEGQALPTRTLAGIARFGGFPAD